MCRHSAGRCILVEFAAIVFISRFGSDEQLAPRFVGMVVGWGACHVLVATSYYKQVSVLYALDEHHTVVAQLLVQQVDELLAVVGSKVSAVVVLYLAVGNADDVAAQGEVVGPHVVAY